MSSNSSKPASKSRFRRAAGTVATIVALLAWVALSFMAAQIVVVFGWQALSTIVPGMSSLSDAAFQFVLTALIYMLTLVFTVGGAFLIRQRVTKDELGVSKWLSWLDLLLAPAAYIGYLIISSIVIMVVTNVIPGFDIGQSQEIGFENIVGRADLIAAFLALVVLAPIAEEVLFRGYLYGKLRTYTGVIVASLLTSVLFGAVHMQWNVAIDTFVLSVVMCGLREATGSIWAGTMVHIIKNGLAFFILFIYPSLGL